MKSILKREKIEILNIYGVIAYSRERRGPHTIPFSFTIPLYNSFVPLFLAEH